MNDDKGACSASLQGSPTLSFVRTDPGLQLGSHAFLRPLPACCAQIASPYWARVIGDVSNNGSDEVLINVSAIIFDEQGLPLGSHADFMVLDPGGKSEFDIKISTFYDNACAYGLEVTESHDF